MRTEPRQKIDRSQHGTHRRERNNNTHLLEASTLSNGTNIYSSNKLSNLIQPTLKAEMNKVNGFGMHFIYKKRGHSPETYRLWTERKRILKPE